MLEVQNLVVKYGMFRALDGVSIKIEDGQVVGIVGSNGAGKSTLMNTIAGLMRPESGSITFDGEDITKVAPHKIVQSGIVMTPEGRKLFPEMTVRENLLVGSAHKRAKAQRAERFELVYKLFPRLKERESQLCRTMSGGEQQMVAVGRGMMLEPKLLILDEPSLGLAPLVVEEMHQRFLDIHRSGVTVLLVEQNVSLALHSAERAYVMSSGSIEIEGSARELLHDDRIRKAYLGI